MSDTLRLGTPRVRAGLTVGGGVGWALVALRFRALPWAVDAAVVVPPCLALGLIEVRARYGARLARLGAIGVRLAALGLAGAFVALLTNAVYPDTLLKLLVVGLPVVVGGVSLAIGTACLAADLWRARLLSTPVAAAWALALPASLGVNALVAPRFDAGIGLSGLAWALVGGHLWRTAGTTPPAAAERRRLPTADPAVAAALLGGLSLALFGLAGFVPLGPVTAVAFVGLTPAFDALHLVAGGVGVGVAATRRPRPARLYDRAAGAGLLVLGSTHLGQLLTPYHLVTAHWSMLFLHLTVGLLLLVVGVDAD
jgi:hypothetical protein